MALERGTSAQSHHSEQELVDRLLSLDGGAWRALFDAQYGRVYGYAYLRLGNAADAEDVAASVFSEAVKGIRSFRYRGIPVAGWLFRIAHHETVDVLKRRQRLPAAIDGDPGAEHVDLAKAVDRLDMREALGGLKQEHRDVLLLRFIEDRSVRDTAAIMQKSEGAVKVLQLRALRAMRRRVGGRER